MTTKRVSANLSDKLLVIPKWPDDRPDDNSEIVTRALEVIRLEASGQDIVLYRKYIADTVFWIKLIGRGREASPSSKRKKELRTVTDTLRKAIALLRREAKLASFIRWVPKGIESPPPLQIQRAFPCSEDHFIGVETLVRNLEEIAAEAQKLSKQIKIGRGSPPSDMMKLNSAIVAYSLLRKADITPTLTDQGQFYCLATIFYEGATGRPEADLSRSCRLVYHDVNLRSGD
jgi:hypothetical protein